MCLFFTERSQKIVYNGNVSFHYKVVFRATYKSRWKIAWHKKRHVFVARWFSRAYPPFGRGPWKIDNENALLYETT